MNSRNVAVAASLVVFVVVLSVFFLSAPWASELHEVPVYSNNSTSGVANNLFLSYPITIILIALLLSSAMIGGVYLAKMEDEP